MQHQIKALMFQNAILILVSYYFLPTTACKNTSLPSPLHPGEGSLRGKYKSPNLDKTCFLFLYAYFDLLIANKSG